MSRSNLNLTISIVTVVLLVAGVAYRVGIFIILAVAALCYVVYSVAFRARDRERRRSIEALIGGGVDSKLAEERNKRAAEYLRLMEYKTKRDEAEYELRPYLPANPRGAKRLINHERLYVQIAEDRNIFGGSPELTYRHLAKWVLIIEHWPRLGAALTRNPSVMKTLENCTKVEDLQKELKLIDPNMLATDEMLSVLSKGVPLSPILSRLVRFEPSAISVHEMTLSAPEADESGPPDAAIGSSGEHNQIGDSPQLG
jgi:hypothetical protein